MNWVSPVLALAADVKVCNGLTRVVRTSPVTSQKLLGPKKGRPMCAPPLIPPAPAAWPRSSWFAVKPCSLAVSLRPPILNVVLMKKRPIALDAFSVSPCNRLLAAVTGSVRLLAKLEMPFSIGSGVTALLGGDYPVSDDGAEDGVKTGCHSVEALQRVAGLLFNAI
jgi:hypothetical protein